MCVFGGGFDVLFNEVHNEVCNDVHNEVCGFMDF